MQENVINIVSGAAVIGIEEKLERAVQCVLRLIEKQHGIAVAFSSGKDSSICAVIALEAMRRAKQAGLPQARHYITSSNTGVENPAVENLLLDAHEEIEAYASRFDLPLEVRMVEPSIASGFVVSTVGRGSLPRTPENGAKRACSVSWKIVPQERLRKKLSRENEEAGYREMVTVIGTRYEESAQRKARMTARGESDVEAVRDASGSLVLSLIANWTLNDVWDALEGMLTGEIAAAVPFASPALLHRLFALYRSANEGVCGVTLGDGGNRSPCGPRFGCAICGVGGAKDKSMESMLKEEGNAYMTGLNQLRNLLVATQFDFSKREMVGRKVSKAGYVALGPDTYSLAFRQSLLRYMLTLDELERERAESVDAALCRGDLERTRENLRMAERQFELVSIKQLVAIDFFWGMHQSSRQAFSALDVWYQVKHLGRRYPIPDLDRMEKTPIPAKRWVKVGDLDFAVPTDGLRSYENELWNGHRHPGRPAAYKVAGQARVGWFVEGEGLEVDGERACQLVEEVYPAHITQWGMHDALEGVRLLLNEEIVKVPKGMVGRYHLMARRGQYMAHLEQVMELRGKTLAEHLAEVAITDAQHAKLVGDSTEEDAPAAQFELFELFEKAA